MPRLIAALTLSPAPAPQEPNARVLARSPHDPYAFLRWLSHESGALALPAAVHAFSPALQSLLQLLLQRDAARRTVQPQPSPPPPSPTPNPKPEP